MSLCASLADGQTAFKPPWGTELPVPTRLRGDWRRAKSALEVGRVPTQLRGDWR
ncbi:MAG: hypothetical protein ACK55Z_29045 [bacterium]